MTFDDFEEKFKADFARLEYHAELMCERAWNIAINSALDKLDEHWYSKDKAQKAVQDLLTA